MRTFVARGVASVATILVVVACGHHGEHVPDRADDVAPSVQTTRAVHIRFAARQATPQGASDETVPRDLRFVKLGVFAGSESLGERVVDEHGVVDVDRRATRVVVRSEADVEIGGARKRITVSQSNDGERPYEGSFDLNPGAVEVQLTVDDEELSGAMHILDTLVKGYQEMYVALPTLELPALFAYWKQDATTDWSYYHGRSAGGRYWIELMAPRSEARATADSDEHDEAIILHEVGHFVFDVQSPATSLGGGHPRGYRVDPSVAFEEGRATWLACFLQKDPHYIDAEGRAPHGSARVDERIEAPQEPRGLGSETSVAGILWDMTDGGEREDSDTDALHVGAEQVFAAMADMSGGRSDFHGLADFLSALQRRLTQVALREQLLETGEPVDVWEMWPPELAEHADGRLDGRSDPAPSGGRNRPDSGYDANRAYRLLALPAGAARASLTLTIRGSGTQATHTDLDLFLLRPDGSTLRVSRGTRATESLTVERAELPLVVYVRDGGGGNRADFALDVQPLQ